ncbi:McrC family protein [Bacillus mesophilum]|uniref:Restriction endonuclease n=1 Tax=Bacillus mesophilum TaxID=1071718 RepID=A0A7V7RJR9_9BACI|nr:McrC family protein [Bacillus mesophilum]KAB2331286.1 restriction endonuclease [Bacillus mesophilum]
MKKTIEIKEFDIITSNKEYKGVYEFLDKESFTLLENMILQFNQNEDADALDFFSITTKRHIGKVIRAKNYVGNIQLNNGIQIQILPKIHGKSANDPKKTFLKMLRSLKDFPNKTFNENSLRTDRMTLFEVFINMYIQEAEVLVKRGLKSSYYTVEDNLNVYKGKVLFSEQLKFNHSHKERLYTRYDEYGKDRAENRLIKSTLLKLLKQSANAENINKIRKLLIHFELIKPSINYLKDFSKVKVDRNTRDYEAIMVWSRVFLNNESFTTFSGNTFGKALLFPMEKVFEAYIGRHLKKLLYNSNWEVVLQDKGYHLFKGKFALRPDIVLKNGNRKIIIDTKWKILNNIQSSNYGISQSDMYQMYAYAKKYGSKEIWLIYPTSVEVEHLKDICFSTNEGEQSAEVKVFFVDCHNVEESLGSFIEKVNYRNKRAFDYIDTSLDSC